MTNPLLSDQESELTALLDAYQERFPAAESPITYMIGFGPEQLCSILREANGREIMFSYPGLGQGVVDGCAYRFVEPPTNPVTIQELLYHRGLPRGARIKLVRHRDASGNIDVHGLYRNNRQGFLDYQCRQTKPVFHNCDYIISCLGETAGRTRFVGVFRVARQEVERDPNDAWYYQLSEVTGFQELKERLIFEWGNAPISWHQWLRADAPKVVLELEPKPFSRPFTDYLDFTLSFAELQELVKSQSPRDEWYRMLSAVAGIYLIQDTSTGQQYIGSAYGEGGVWQRWIAYVKTNGHGNNVALRKLLTAEPDYARHFQFTLLMTLPKSMTDKEVFEHEKLFKRKLGSRAFGFNLN